MYPSKQKCYLWRICAPNYQKERKLQEVQEKHFTVYVFMLMTCKSVTVNESQYTRNCFVTKCLPIVHLKLIMSLSKLKYQLESGIQVDYQCIGDPKYPSLYYSKLSGYEVGETVKRRERRYLYQRI